MPSYVAFDIETTGLDSNTDSIIELERCVLSPTALKQNSQPWSTRATDSILYYTPDRHQQQYGAKCASANRRAAPIG